MESFHIEKMGYSMQKAKMVYAGSVYIPGEDHWVISKDIFLNIICDSICCFFSTNSDSILFLIWNYYPVYIYIYTYDGTRGKHAQHRNDKSVVPPGSDREMLDVSLSLSRYPFAWNCGHINLNTTFIHIHKYMYKSLCIQVPSEEVCWVWFGVQYLLRKYLDP